MPQAMVACPITAIHMDNGNGESNTITLAADLYTLTAVDNVTDGPTGLPSITSALMLRGQGALSTIIERAANAPRFRLLHVAARGALTLERLTARGGDLIDFADRSGSFFNRGSSLNRGTITIAHSMLSGNAASGNGGGINQFESNTTLTNSTLSGNTASGLGGAISLGPHGSATLTNSTVSGNMASQGGGVYGNGSPLNLGVVSLQNTLLAGNWVPPTALVPTSLTRVRTEADLLGLTDPCIVL